MNNNRRIIKFEEFDFEAANNTGKYNNIANREKAEIAAMKSFNESEIKNVNDILEKLDDCVIDFQEESSQTKLNTIKKVVKIFPSGVRS